MQLDSWFVFAGEVLVCLFLGALVLNQLKRFFTSYSMNLYKETWSDENVNVGVSFMFWDSPDTMERKAAQLYRVGNARKRVNLDEHNRIMKQAEESKAADVRKIKG